MKIRLHGTEDEFRELAGRLPAITDVPSVSEPYPDRGTSRLVRVYTEARRRPGVRGPRASRQHRHQARPQRVEAPRPLRTRNSWRSTG